MQSSPGPKQFSVVTAAISIGFICIFLCIAGTHIRVARTVRVYEAQKDLVATVCSTLIRELETEGSQVTNDSTGLGGSGEWRQHVAITITTQDGRKSLLYVEVMGFVSHDAHGQPNWYNNLPMKISHYHRPLDLQFTDLLTRNLRRHGWQYSVDSNCIGFEPFGPPQYNNPSNK